MDDWKVETICLAGIPSVGEPEKPVVEEIEPEKPWPKIKRSKHADRNFVSGIEIVLEIAGIQKDIDDAVGRQPLVGWYAKGSGIISWNGYDYHFNYPGHALDFMKEILKTGDVQSWVERKKRGETEREVPRKILVSQEST